MTPYPRAAMRRRGYGSGALYERNGVWYGRWHAASGARPHRRIGMTRKPGSRDGLTRNQAERELRRLMDAEELLRPPDRAAPTLGELGEMLTSRLQTLGRKRSTIESVESHVRIHIAPWFGDVGVDEERLFEDEPERAVVDPASAAFDRGAALFFEWLDANFATYPGALVGGLWSLAPTKTGGHAWRWSGTPTGFDVLRVSLKNALGTDSTLDDVLARFAVHRALASPAARVAWHVPWPAKARRFASPIPVTPTGASVVLIDVAGAPAGAKLRVEAAWEDFGRMRWEIVKLDAQGRDLADIPVTSLPLGTSASMTVEPLDGVDRVVVVGANVGSTEHPFEPNQGWWEPHGWLLTIEGE